MLMVHVVEAETSLHAEALFIGGPMGPVDPEDFFVLDLQADLAPDTAVRADRVHGPVKITAVTSLFGVDNGGRHESSRRAGLNTFAASDAGRSTHRVVHVEHDLAVVSTPRHSNDVVHLNFPASTYTQVAMYACIEIDLHGHMAVVEQGNAARFDGREPGFRNALKIGHVPEMGRPVHEQLRDRVDRP